MSFLNMVSDNIRRGLVNLRGVELSTDFAVKKEVRAATSIASPVTINRLDETKLKYTNYGFAVVAASYTGTAPSNGIQMKLEFMTDSLQFEIKTIGTIATYSIFIDGKLCNQNAVVTPNGEGVSWINVSATTGSVVRKMRHVEIYGINSAIGAVVVAPFDTVTSDIAKVRPFIYQMGDSYTYGTGAAHPLSDYGSSPAINDFYAYSRALGFDGIAEGIGGSGWNSTGGQYPATRVSTRLKNLNRKPDVISFALGYNDAAAIMTGTNKDKLVASMGEAVSAARDAWPGVPVIIISCATPKGITANIQAVYDLIKEFCFNSGVELIEVSEAVTSANSSVYTGTDNVHPNGVGHQYRGLTAARYVYNKALSGTCLIPDFSRGFTVNFIKKDGFSVEVLSEVVDASSQEEAEQKVKYREIGKPNLRIEII